MMKEDLSKIHHQHQMIKERLLREKYFLGLACFQLATHLCVRFMRISPHNTFHSHLRFRFLLKYSSMDSIRLIEYFDDLARIDTHLNGFRNKLTRDHLIELQLEILSTIDYQFPQYTAHLFISYFLRYLSSSLQEEFISRH